MKRDVIQGAVLIGLAIILAVVSNAIASRERKLVLPGYYPAARQVPARATAETTAPIPTTNTVTESAAPPVTTTISKPSNPATQQPSNRVEKPRTFPPHPDKPYIEIGYDDVAWLHRNGALFLDARRTSAYEQGHIASSRPFSVWESDVDEKVNNLFSERSDPRDQEKPIVVYCSGGDCEDSHMLSQKLWGLQFNNVYVYKDGYPDWQKRGGAVRVGATP